MPWKVAAMSELRSMLVHQVVSLKRPVAEVCREHGVSRKTAYKWLARQRTAPGEPLQDRSRRPRRSPRRTADDLEAQVVAARKQYGWGARKLRALLIAQGVRLPSLPAVHAILRRHDLIAPLAAADTSPPQFFTRSEPNELWQCDHKGPLEVARRKAYPLAVVDDHSRFLLALNPCRDLSMMTAFAVLWEAFGQFGMPESLLCDNAFGSHSKGPKTLSWFDSRLVLLGIHPTHGRPYHPQTQGKVERFNGTLQRELWPFLRRDTWAHFSQDLDRWRTEVYNPLRPHEALQDQPPLSRFRLSPRKRPERLPCAEYPTGSTLRKVSTSGDVRWHKYRILAGRGLVGELVRIEERDHEVALFFSWKEIRALAYAQLQRDNML
jgi:transposase InsO family protein